MIHLIQKNPMRRSISSSLSLILVFLVVSSFYLLGTVHAKANVESTQNRPIVLADCKNAPTIPCIEEVDVRTKNGIVTRASLTGRLTPVDQEFIGPGYPEYSVAGLTFEGTSKNQFIPRIVYYPFLDDSDCVAITGCLSGRDFLAFGVQPSWLNRATINPTENELPLTNRSSNLLCGTPEKRDKCYRSNNFDVEIDFLFKIKMPRGFAPIWASGSARNVTIDNWTAFESSQQDHYLLETTIGTLPRQMVLFSDFYQNPIDAIEASPYADYPADWPGIWIHSARDRSVNPLGECRNVPFMSISTNGIYQEVPFWNSETESIDLKLYAPHLKVNGDLNRGFYELRISEELARCFWKIDVSDKTQARVLISYPGASEDVVVEATSISLREGVLEVLASNFTFSGPTIKTKILQSSQISKPETESSNSKSSTSTARSLSKSVSQKSKKCVKGSKTVAKQKKTKCSKGIAASR